MEWVISIAVIWVGCGILAYGLTFAHFQNKFPTIARATKQTDRRFALFVAAAGPIGLIVCFVSGKPTKYGIRWR